MIANQTAAAPCCSANSAAPALISGDDRAQFALLASHAQIIGDAPPAGTPVFRASNDTETSQYLRAEGAFLLSDRWQVGAGFPLVRRHLNRPGVDSTRISLGDLRMSAAYEVLPEWEYSFYKPKAYFFSQWILPTGKSIYESADPRGVEATGQGFWTFATGILLLKKWRFCDSYFMPELHYSLERTFNHSSAAESVSVSPGFGASAPIGIGYSPGAGSIRIGSRLQPTYASSKRVRSNIGESYTSKQLSWDLSLELGWVIEENWSLNASYTDQTVIGPAMGTTLSRSVALSLQHRWPR